MRNAENMPRHRAGEEHPSRSLCKEVRDMNPNLFGVWIIRGCFLAVVAVLAIAVMWGCGDTAGSMEQGQDPGPVPDAATDVFPQPGMPFTAPGNGPDNRQVSQEGERRAAESCNRFGLDLYACLKVREGNLLFSPSSISTALTMLCVGAGGQTRREMESTLHLSRYGFVLQDSAPPPGPELVYQDAAGSPETARALWIQQGSEYRREYLDLLQQRYGADAFAVDFSADPGQALERINAWAIERTQGTITALLDEDMVHAGTELVVTDVIWFSGKWLEPFNREDTSDRAFRINRGETVQAPFMHREAVVRTLAFEEGDMIGIPFDAGMFSLIILLPREGADLAAIEEGMTYGRLAGMLDRLAGSPEIRVELSLPRFAVKDGYELADTLGAMGMRTAFTQEADFSGITSRKNLVLTAVVHKAFLEVREEGVEAAAGSGAVMTKGSRTVAAFVADRPFVFIIREDKTGLLLFLGRFVDPRG